MVRSSFYLNHVCNRTEDLSFLFNKTDWGKNWPNQSRLVRSFGPPRFFIFIFVVVVVVVVVVCVALRKTFFLGFQLRKIKREFVGF